MDAIWISIGIQDMDKNMDADTYRDKNNAKHMDTELMSLVYGNTKNETEKMVRTCVAT